MVPAASLPELPLRSVIHGASRSAVHGQLGCVVTVAVSVPAGMAGAQIDRGDEIFALPGVAGLPQREGAVRGPSILAEALADLRCSE